MQVETMIYAYFAICAGMIIFNLLNAVISRRRDRWALHVSRGFEKRIREELGFLETHSAVRSEHKKWLARKLRAIGNLKAFDAALESHYAESPEHVGRYLQAIDGVFVSLSIGYGKKESMELAYLPYMIKKYRILAGRPFHAMIGLLFQLLHDPSIYCRENAMQALYTVGDCSYVIQALKIIDRENKFYHSKLLTDGLLTFEGSREMLGDALWKEWDRFSVSMQIALLNYFRFSSGGYCEPMLRLMNDETCDDELRFCCIRYFGKYRYEAAYRSLLYYADIRNPVRWEYAAIASSVLSAYPSAESVEVLKANLHHRNWYIRFNSSQSLEKMGLTYLDLIDILEGEDRYASEILRYRFDIRNLISEEQEGAAV